MTTFHQRLRTLREQHRLTQAELGAAANVTGQAVQHWEREGGTIPQGVKLKVIADFLGTTTDYLLSGINPPNPNKLNEPAGTYHANTPNHAHTVPILDFVTAAQPPKEWQSTDAIGTAGTALKHSKQAFAVINPNNNMHNPAEDISFRRGDILIIEPNIKPIDGDFVFACINADEHTAIIAQLQINPITGGKMLKLTGNPNINPNPFALEAPAFICGTITERKTRIIDEATIKARLK